MNNTNWTKWKSRYEEKNYTVYLPANPCHEETPACLRDKVHPDLTKTGFIDVVKNIAKHIDYFLRNH